MNPHKPAAFIKLAWRESREQFWVTFAVFICAFLVIGISISVLAGWYMGVRYLQEGLANSEGVKPIVALLLMGLGTSLFLLKMGEESDKESLLKSARFLSMAIIVICVLILADYFVHTNFYIEEGIYRFIGLSLSYPKGSAPNTVVSVLFLSLAFLFLSFRKSFKSVAAFVLIVFTISYFAVIGYLYSTPVLYSVKNYAPMALFTAACLMILTLGIMFLRPKEGFVSILLSDTAGSQMLRRLLPGVLIVPAFVGWVRLWGEQRGLYSLGFGLAMHVVITTLILGAIVWQNGRHLYKIDTERQSAERQMRHQALHDALTGLPNRKSLEDGFELLKSTVDRSETRRMIGVMFLDLDRFKTINDTLGHYVGDRILKEVAQRFSSAIRKNDVIARLGGDEFLILAEVDSIDELVALAEDIKKCLKSIIKIDDYYLHVTTSIGISLYPEDGHDIYTLLKHADVALYRAKSAGRDNYKFYDFSMSAETYEKLRLENDLRYAVRNNELILHYQPIVNESDEIVTIESLLRWNHPRLGLLYPSDFISIAEETGVILQMGEWVLKEAVRQRKIWLNAGLKTPTISINLSSRQFAEFDLIKAIRKVVDSEGLDPRLLQVEVTESTAMENIERTNRKLEELRALGILISIDDFGKGYSSLSYLKGFPADCLKIDKSFVRFIASDGPDRTIVQAIVGLAKSLNLNVVAEGVETREQMQVLRDIGCPFLQGFFISEPSDTSNFEKRWLPQALIKQA